MRIENTSLSQPIQPMTLAINTQRPSGMRGVGFLPLAAIGTAFASGEAAGFAGEASGLFGEVKNFFSSLIGVKDPDKAAFDHYRQQIWDKFAGIVGMKDNYSGTLDRETFSRFINNVRSVISEHDALYNDYKQKIEAAWIDPRYRDFNDFFHKVLSAWEQEITEIHGGFSASTLLAGMDGTTMLLLGGLAFMFLRK